MTRIELAGRVCDRKRERIEHEQDDSSREGRCRHARRPADGNTIMLCTIAHNAVYATDVRLNAVAAVTIARRKPLSES